MDANNEDGRVAQRISENGWPGYSRSIGMLSERACSSSQDASSTNPDLLVSAYEGKDKMRTVIATNRSTSPQSLTVNWPGTTWSELELVSQYDENERETGSNRTVIQPGEIVVFSTMVSPPMD
jgi:hypothetical protein